jgi:hypothetical protein
MVYALKGQVVIWQLEEINAYGKRCAVFGGSVHRHEREGVMVELFWLILMFRQKEL